MTPDPIDSYRAELAGRLVTLSRQRQAIVQCRQSLVFWWSMQEVLMAILYLVLLLVFGSLGAYINFVGRDDWIRVRSSRKHAAH